MASVNVKKAGAGSGSKGPSTNPYDEGGPSPMLEGPGHTCTTGTCADAPFQTKDWKEWRQHLKTHAGESYELGVQPCAICGNEVDMIKHPTRAGSRAIHRECLPEAEVL